MTEKDRPDDQEPEPPEPPPFDPDPDLIGEMERGQKPDENTKQRIFPRDPGAEARRAARKQAEKKR